MTEKNKARAGETATGAISDNNAMMDKGTPIPEISGSLNDDLTETGSFPDAVFNDLPDLLFNPCQQLEGNEREVFLVGALAVLSGILPNVRGFYDDQLYSPHLYAFVVAPHGSGKGSLKLAYQLGKAIHRHLKERSAQEIADWKQACLECAQTKQAPPPHPGNKMLFLPANNSKSGLIGLISENGGTGIIFESEGDTLADTLKSDHGHYSDLLRKAFHHERITLFRKTDAELREIEDPALAVLLSATFDQYTKLIPTPANGLFSRLMHFCPQPNKGFRNVFDTTRRTYPEYFNQLGEQFKDIYLHLNALQNPIEYFLQDRQCEQFLKTFGQWKADFSEFISPEMEGTSHRLALIAFRISMVLTAVRNFGEGDFSEKMYCTQTDFENSLRIIETLKRHALDVFNRLPKPAERSDYTELKTELYEKADQVAQCRLLAAQGKKPAEIARIVLGDDKKRSKVFYWLNSGKQ